MEEEEEVKVPQMAQIEIEGGGATLPNSGRARTILHHHSISQTYLMGRSLSVSEYATSERHQYKGKK